jgi:hypothetical protein
MTEFLNWWRDQLNEAVYRARRTTPGPLLVRGGVFVTGLLGLLLAWPFGVVAGPGALVLVVLAAVPAFAPRGRLPAAVILASVGGWLMATMVYAEAPAYLRLVLLATALYLQHNLCALAAVLPYDAVIAPGVLLRWLARASVVVLLTAVLALFGSVAPLYLSGSYLAASLAGLALMGLTVGYLARLVGRR